MALRQGDRRALARAITLAESTRPDHREETERLVEALLPYTGGAVRIGISGPPGAGKSTFIERFGLEGIKLGRRVAVLAVDPASKRGGGAILGDKTRMTELARSPAAFIRPSSAGDRAGGVARRTREAILLCEAAGIRHGAGRDGRRWPSRNGRRRDRRHVCADPAAGGRRRAARDQARRHRAGRPRPRQQGGRRARCGGAAFGR